MNKGIEVSTGKYLYFLNAGDFLFNDTVLESLIDQASYEYHLIYGDFIKCLANGEMLYRKQPNSLSLVTFFRTSITQQATLIHRDLFKILGYYDESYKIVSDWKFFMEAILLDNLSYKYLNFPFAVFSEGGMSNNESFADIHVQERKKVFEELNLPNTVKNNIRQLVELQVRDEDISSRRLIPWAIRIEDYLRRIRKFFLFI